MSTEPAHFRLIEGGAFMPTPFALSRWGDGQLNGPAVVGLAAQALENHCGSEDFMPTRFTADLFRAARNAPTAIDVRVVRDGRRVRSAECDVMQDGRTVARATLVQYRRSSAPPGRQWTAPNSLVQPPPPDDQILPHVGSNDAGWTRSPAAHQNDSRKYFYHDAIKVREGEENSPFVRAVVIAEATSLVTNLGTHGIGYINGDLTAAFSRLPVDDWIGVQADSHWASDGISVGTATLFDHLGGFGSGVVTAVANPAAQIDFSRGVTPLKGLNYE
jgi:acyl-CoA thioesterase